MILVVVIYSMLSNKVKWISIIGLLLLVFFIVCRLCVVFLLRERWTVLE